MSPKYIVDHKEGANLFVSVTISKISGKVSMLFSALD